MGDRDGEEIGAAPEAARPTIIKMEYSPPPVPPPADGRHAARPGGGSTARGGTFDSVAYARGRQTVVVDAAAWPSGAKTKEAVVRRRWTVRDVMTADVVFVSPDTGYKEIVETMLGNAVSALPVVNDAGRVVGIVSELDLLHKVEFATEEPHRRLFERQRERVARAKGAADTAEDLMTSPAIVIRDNATVAAASIVMHRQGIKRLPVVDAHGMMLGIVSRGDVLRGFLRSDAEIRWEVAEEVLRRSMWLEPYEVQATVDRGVVTLEGHVERRSMAEVTVELVRATVGVVDVVDKLTYRTDDTNVRSSDRVSSGSD
jgi:CBS domain-containing protein